MCQTKKFTRTKEDFTCTYCGAKVLGNGYTNHCPKCLWSKHVDINPGDRAAACSGLMEPVGVEQKGQEYRIIHRCQRCHQTKANKLSAGDGFEGLLENIK